MACFGFSRQGKSNFLEQLLIEMEGVWWLESNHVIEKQSALERRTVDFLDNLLDNLVLAHYYSVTDSYPESEKYLIRSGELVDQFETKIPKKQQELECARVSVIFSNLLTISRKMRSDTIGTFMDLYMKFKRALNKNETLRKSTAGIIASTMVELAHCDIHFRLGPSDYHSLDKISMQVEELKKLIGLVSLRPILRVYALRALGDIEYHKGLITFLKGDNEAACKRFKTALKWYIEVKNVLLVQNKRDPHCRSQFCVAMMLATGCAGEDTSNIYDALDEIRKHLYQPELPLVVKRRLSLLEGSLSLFKDRNFEFTDNFLKEFGFLCEEQDQEIDSGNAETFILFSFELLELVERKLRFLAADRKWKRIASFYEACRVPGRILSTFSHIMRIMKTLRIICLKTRSSVRRHERLKELMVKKVKLEYGALKFWQEKAFFKLFKYFARNGNGREFNNLLLLNEKLKFLTNEDINTWKNLLEQSPIVSTKNGIFLYFDNFKDEEEKKVDGVDKKKFHSVEEKKDIETLRDILGLPAVVHHDQKTRNEILEEVAQKSNPDNHSSLSILVIVFIGHGKAYKRETEFETTLITAHGDEVPMWEIKETIAANFRKFNGRPPVAWIIVDTCRGTTDLGEAQRLPEMADQSVPQREPRRHDDGHFVETDDLYPNDEEPDSHGFANEEGEAMMLSTFGNNNTNNFNDVHFDADADSLVSADSLVFEDSHDELASNEALDNTNEFQSAESNDIPIPERDVITPVSTPSIVITYATLNLCYAYCIPQTDNKHFGYSPFMKNLLEAVRDEEFYCGQGPWNLRQLLRTVNSNMSKASIPFKDEKGNPLKQRSTGEDSLREDFVLSKDTQSANLSA